MPSYKDIEIPLGITDLNRTQLWAMLKQASTDLHWIMMRARLFDIETCGPLFEEEQRRLFSVKIRLDNFADTLNPNVLDSLAKLPEAKSADEVRAEQNNLPLEVSNLLHAFHGDIDTFVREHDECENLVLAFALLAHVVGLDGEDMARLIPSILGRPDRAKSRAWTCPVCEGRMRLYKQEHGKPCSRCCGWGYVFAEPTPEEYAALEAAEAEKEEAANSDGAVDS